MAKIPNDKYYTPPDLAEYIVNKTKEIIGEKNITEYIEPGVNNMEGKTPYTTGYFEVEGIRQPHRCPVCGGNGLVPNGFYDQVSGEWWSSDASSETCRSCNGTGIVWG